MEISEATETAKTAMQAVLLVSDLSEIINDGETVDPETQEVTGAYIDVRIPIEDDQFKIITIITRPDNYSLYSCEKQIEMLTVDSDSALELTSEYGENWREKVGHWLATHLDSEIAKK